MIAALRIRSTELKMISFTKSLKSSVPAPQHWSSRNYLKILAPVGKAQQKHTEFKDFHTETCFQCA